jgi:hypothetical protein
MGPDSAAAGPAIQPDQLPLNLTVQGGQRRVGGALRVGAAARRGGEPRRPVGQRTWRERELPPLGLWFPSNAAREGWATSKIG